MPARLRRGDGLQRQLDHPLLGESGDSAFYLKRTLIFGAARPAASCTCSPGAACKALRPLTPLLLAGSFFLLRGRHAPGRRHQVNGAARWLGSGPLQIQPSELAKVALILYGAHLLATRPEIVTRGVGAMAPFLAVVGAGVLADRGRARPRHGAGHVAFAIAALLVAAGARLRDLGAARRARSPWSCCSRS